jgi:hypothetical protein
MGESLTSPRIVRHLSHRPAAGECASDEEELAGLVGGEGEADVLLGEPGGEVAGAEDFDLRLGWGHAGGMGGMGSTHGPSVYSQAENRWFVALRQQEKCSAGARFCFRIAR